MTFKIRAATKDDCKDISRMIMDLATFEKMPEKVKLSHKDLERDGFGQSPLFECLVAEVPEEHKSKEGFTVVGFALYVFTYGAWTGRTVYLDNLYVMPDFRVQNIGNTLLYKVAAVAKQQQCMRLHMSVLDWNTTTRGICAEKGAQDLTASEGWHFLRFDGQDLDNLANEAPKD